MAYELRYVALSDVGRVRTVNQDSGYASSRLLILADGMGGAAAGDLAASEVMHVVTRLDKDIDGDALEALAGTVHRANDRLAEVIEDDPTVEGMGTTLTALMFNGESIAMAHIGDSRAYRLRDGLLTQLTDDHTFVQSLVDEGRISPEDAKTHPHRSVILRVLLGRDDCEPDLSRLEPRPGDRYLVCSDGLSGMIDDDRIAEILGTDTIELASVELVRHAIDAGGTDNITCVIGEVVDSTAEPAAPPSSTADQPMLVGAASEQPRSRGTETSTLGAVSPPHETHGDDTPAGNTHTVDPEELRYAPRAPRRFRWLRRGITLVVVLAILAVAAKIAYDWSQDQYYVAESDGNVAIFRGVPQEVPGIDLSSLAERTDIAVDSLPTYSQEQVRDAVDTKSYESATNVVDNLRELSERCADPDAEGEECEGADSGQTTKDKNNKSGNQKGKKNKKQNRNQNRKQNQKKNNKKRGSNRRGGGGGR